MRHIPTTIALVVLTLVAVAAAVLAIVRVKSNQRVDVRGRWLRTLVAVCAVGSAGVFVYRMLWVHHNWQPLQMHVDGLLLLAALFAAAILYLQHPARLPGLSPFALPLLAWLLAWGICASYWTAYAFKIDSVWLTLHLIAVYTGALFFLVAAIAGGMYLYVQRQLHRKRNPSFVQRFASLEATEKLIIRSATLGFVLLTVGLIMGLVRATSGPSAMGPDWWYSPKVVLAFVVWLIYALLINVRHTTTFRGARAAWLSILGLVLLLATFVLAVALPAHPAKASTPSAVTTSHTGGTASGGRTASGGEAP